MSVLQSLSLPPRQPLTSCPIPVRFLMFYDFKILQQTQTPPAMSFQLMLPAPVEARHVSLDTTSGKTEVQLSQEQSLCLVKVFINASLGCICFSRGLIPSDSPTYQDRRVDDLSLIPLTSSLASYHSFLSYQGELSVDNESQVFKVLLGGKDKRADHILNLVVCHRSHVSVG